MNRRTFHTLEEARDATPGLEPAPRPRPCVIAYLTRGRGAAADLLVLEGHPGGGLQVPAGGIDEGESLPAALGREVLEETGLAPSGSPVFLGSTDFLYEPPGLPPVLERRHYLWLEVPMGTPDVWSHRVTGGEADGGLLFTLRFAPLENIRLDWALDELIPTLKELLT